MRIRKVSKTTQTGAQIIDGYSNSQVSGYSCNYANKAFGGKILWTNEHPENAFASQTITLSSSDYDYYEVYCTYSNTTLDYLNAFKSIKGKGVLMYILGYGTNLSARRKIDYTDATHLLVYGGKSNSDDNNSYVIPVYVVGYKK